MLTDLGEASSKHSQTGYVATLSHDKNEAMWHYNTTRVAVLYSFLVGVTGFQLVAITW